MEKRLILVSLLTLSLVVAITTISGYEYLRLKNLEMSKEEGSSQKVAEASAKEGSLSPAAREGEKLYLELGCNACHKIKGKGGEGGPDLSYTGAKRDTEWHFKYLKDPQALVPGSTMPNMGLSDEDARAIAAYMSTLK